MAALAGQGAYLFGRKETVILGHLIPAEIGFYLHQNAETRINVPEAHSHAQETAADALAPTET